MDKITKLFHTMVILGILFLFACSSSGNSEALTGPTWNLVSYGPASNQVAAVAGANTSLTFARDGNMSGNVGCNGFGGEYKLNGDKITFGPIMRTLMACDGPVMQQEDTVLQVFDGTASYKLESGKLTITSADGSLAVILIEAGK